MTEEIQQIIENPSNRKKFHVHFKFKGSEKSYQEWVTYGQYLSLKDIKNLEFCKITN